MPTTPTHTHCHFVASRPCARPLACGARLRRQETAVGMIEVVVVLVIVAILLAIAIFQLTGPRRAASTASAVAVAQGYGDAVTAFTKEHGGRAPRVGTNDWPLAQYLRGPVNVAEANRPYLRRVPEAAQQEEVQVRVADEPTPNAVTSRVTYEVLADDQWRLTVESRRNASSAWSTACRLGTDLGEAQKC